MPESLTYGYVEEYTDKYFSDPELTAEFPNILPLWESLEKERTFEALKPLRLQERCMVFSIAELRSEAGYQMVYLPGWGRRKPCASLRSIGNILRRMTCWIFMWM